MWNGVEIIQHQHRDHYPQSQKICPVILIADVTPDATPNPYDTYGAGYGYDSVNYGSYQNNQNLRRNRNRAFRKQHWRNMSLLWDEGAFTVEYKLRYDQSKPGLWISSGAHNSKYIKYYLLKIFEKSIVASFEALRNFQNLSYLYPKP